MRDGIFVRRTQPVESRFWSKVEFTESCWLWNGPNNGTGYGHMFVDGKTAYAHRWAYEYLVGPIAKGYVLDHLCRVRHCVNPSHLEQVTQRENILRGTGLAARAAAKTECLRGHSLTDPSNLTERGKSRGRRACMACARIYRARHYEKRKRIEMEAVK